jgi:hypothetical protein
MRQLFLLTMLAVALVAQTTHSATLTWQDALNPAGTTYNVYRAPGLCSGSPVFAKMATGIAAKTYQDTTVVPGPYCYAVSATFNGVESAQSNTAAANVPAFAPTALGITVQ